MMDKLEKHLADYYQAFDADHPRRRAQLLALLPAARRLSPSELRTTWSERMAVYHSPAWIKPLMAAAAVLVILLSVTFFHQSSFDSQAAWAQSMQNFARINSVHLRAQMQGSDLQIWWKRPNEIRMVFSNGLIITGNRESRQVYDAAAKTLTITPPDAAGADMAVLGLFGQLFTSTDLLSIGWMQETSLVSSEEIVYKGENCRKLTFAGKDRRCEYILEPELHLIYQITMFAQNDPAKVIYRMEVMDVDRPMPAELFTIEPSEDTRIKDRRTAAPMPMPPLSK